MREEDEVILALCQQSQGRSVQPRTFAQGFDWPYFLKTVRSQRIAPSALTALLSWPLPPEHRDLILQRSKKEVRRALLVNGQFRKELDRVLPRLGASGIDCILLKGLGLDHDGLRVINDLDILIRLQDLDETLVALGGVG